MSTKNNLAKFAQVDPATALAPIFRPTTRGQPPKSLVVNVNHGNLELMFTCFHAPDTMDQSILLAIIGMAGIKHESLTDGTDGPIGQALWADLQPENSALASTSAVVTTTRYQLLTTAGLGTTGAYYERLADRLYRLSQIGCRVRRGPLSWAMNLLSYRMDHVTGEIVIALNSRFAEALSGESQFVRIELDERRHLKTDSARALHAWLCATINVGRSGVWCGIDTLSQRVWGVQTQNDSTKRRRREFIKSALHELQAQGWRILTRGSGANYQVLFTRPSIVTDGVSV